MQCLEDQYKKGAFAQSKLLEEKEELNKKLLDQVSPFFILVE